MKSNGKTKEVMRTTITMKVKTGRLDGKQNTPVCVRDTTLSTEATSWKQWNGKSCSMQSLPKNVLKICKYAHIRQSRLLGKTQYERERENNFKGKSFNVPHKSFSPLKIV